MFFSSTNISRKTFYILVLEDKQYKEISKIIFRSEGTVRNRLNKLYDTLGVADRIGFITTYAGYEIFFDESVTPDEELLYD